MLSHVSVKFLIISEYLVIIAKRQFTVFLLIAMIFTGRALLSQNPEDTIITSSVNTMLIERLVREGIDSVRINAGLNALHPDTSLVLAANDHAVWLVRQKTISHRQPVPSKSTVQRRAEYYGGSGFLCGENIAASYIADLMADKNGRTYHNITYRQIADEFIRLWINSRSHQTNILNPAYGYTGVAISYNPESRRVVAVQVFGFLNRKG